MIDEARTLEIYGYTSDMLPPMSSKPIISVCEECGKYRVSRKPDLRTLCLPCSRTLPEYRDNMSKNHVGLQSGTNHPLFGKHHTEEAKKKMRDNHSDQRGEKNSNWRGGITTAMETLRKSPSYNNWRRAVYERDDYTCRMCDDNTGGNLQAHHIRPARDHKNDLLLLDVDNGITLCKKCHESVKGHEHEYINKFEVILR